MQVNAILCCVSCAAYILLLATWPVRKKRMLSQLGECVLPLKHYGNRLFVLVLVCSPLLIVFSYFRDFGVMINAVLCASAVLAAEVGMKDQIFGKLAGIYQCGIIVDGRYLPYDQIRSIPELGYEKNDAEQEVQDGMYERALKLVTEKSGIIYVGFADKAEKQAALAAVIGMEPRLKP